MPSKYQAGGGGSMGSNFGGRTTGAGGTSGTRAVRGIKPMRNPRKVTKTAVTKNDSGVGKGTYGWGFDTTRKGFRMTVSKQLKKSGNTVGKPSAKKGLKPIKLQQQNNDALVKSYTRNQPVVAKGARNVLVKKTKSANVLKKGKK
jgi:hypothetical protein